jgi:FAD synthetase
MYPTKKVVVWGTFDMLHEGHLEFLKNASSYGELYVIVVPDEVVMNNKHHLPAQNHFKRKEKLERLDFVKRVYIDCVEYGLESIEIINPDYFCVGYDQLTVWEDVLSNLFDSKNINAEIIRLNIYANGLHTTDIIANEHKDLI